MNNNHCTAVLLSAGRGSRMHSEIPKQYLPLAGKPVLWYSLNTIEQSNIIDDCVLVCGADDIEYVKKEIVSAYNFRKVCAVLPGGAERYASVANALHYLAGGRNTDGFIFIHDGARPFLTETILRGTYEAVRRFHACVAAVPSKDTVKIADADGFVAQTPDRRCVWNIQTPQVFDAALIENAYARLTERLPELQQKGIAVTDDAGVVELMTDCRVKLVEASYTNLKITTPEDLRTAESVLGAAR